MEQVSASAELQSIPTSIDESDASLSKTSALAPLTLRHSLALEDSPRKAQPVVIVSETTDTLSLKTDRWLNSKEP